MILNVEAQTVTSRLFKLLAEVKSLAQQAEGDASDELHEIAADLARVYDKTREMEVCYDVFRDEADQVYNVEIG